jgi:hypothetical protein
MKYIPAPLALKLSRQWLLTQKHSPSILFATGIVGVVATAVFASKATLRLEDVLEKTEGNLSTSKELYESKHQDYSLRDYRQDQVTVYLRGLGSVAKLYAPAISVGVISIACLTGSHKILTNRNAGLMAAYASLEKGFEKYRQRVSDEFGPEKELELRHGIETREVVREDKDGKKKTEIVKVPAGMPSMYARFFDEYCKGWNKTPEYNLVFIRCQQNYLNDLLHARGHVMLNDAYDALGIDRSKAGCVVGWILDKDSDNFIDFGVYDGDNERARDFVNGREGSILLDFNVSGVIYDRI